MTRFDRLMLLLLAAVAPLLAWCAWSLGRHDQASVSASPQFMIQGGSMAPTLLGQSDLARCQACRLSWDVQASAGRQELGRMRCPHCGDAMLLAGGRGQDGSHRRGPDVVKIRPRHDDASPLQRGQLVAIDWDGRRHVKRIAALPGDTIDLDESHLMVNGKRLEDLLIDERASVDLPRFLVDRDDRRESSRWSAGDVSGTWTRTSDCQWQLRNSDQAGWLVYQHQSVYDGNRPSPVWDDCPFNVGLQRKMFGVDRFCLEGKANSQRVVLLEVAFWSRDGNLLATVETNGDQQFRVNCYEAQPKESLPVSDQKPLAIRLARGCVTLSGLTIHRLVEYRLRPHDDRDPYPLKVPAGQCFVVGDNVPISVDSRDIGTIPIENIVGVCSSGSAKPNRKHEIRNGF